MLRIPKRIDYRKSLFVVAYGLVIVNVALVGANIYQSNIPAPDNKLAFISPEGQQAGSSSQDSEPQVPVKNKTSNRNGSGSANSEQLTVQDKPNGASAPVSPQQVASPTSTTQDPVTKQPAPEPGRGGGVPQPDTSALPDPNIDPQPTTSPQPGGGGTDPTLVDDLGVALDEAKDSVETVVDATLQ